MSEILDSFWLHFENVFKDEFLELAVMYTSGATTDFHAIDDEVVMIPNTH